MPPSCYRALDVMSNCLQKSDLYFQNSTRAYVPKKIMRETDNEAWEFLEDLAEITRYWKSNTEKSLAPHSTAKTNIHSINSSMATKAKLVILMHVIELLENQGFLVSQIAHPLINIVKIHTMLPMSIIS